MPADERSRRSVVPVPPCVSTVFPLVPPVPPCSPLYTHCSAVRGERKGGPTGAGKGVTVNNGEKGGTRGNIGRLKGGKRAIARLFRTVDGMNDDPIFRRLFEGSPVVSALTDAELATASTAANASTKRSAKPPPCALPASGGGAQRPACCGARRRGEAWQYRGHIVALRPAARLPAPCPCQWRRSSTVRSRRRPPRWLQ